MEISENCLMWLQYKYDKNVEATLWELLTEEEQAQFSDVRKSTLNHIDYLEKLEKDFRYLYSSFNALPTPVSIKDHDAKYLFVNDTFETKTGASRKECIGHDVYDVPSYSDEEKNFLAQESFEVLQTLSVKQKENIFVQNGQKRSYKYWIAGFETNKLERGLVSFYYDVTNIQEEFAKLNKKISNLTAEQQNSLENSMHDPLTGAYNRSVIEDYVEIAFQSAKRNKEFFSILMIDIDYFKKVNDTFGHLIGDQILQLMVVVIQKLIREKDMVIRFGGEEFMVLLPGAPFHVAQNVAERIRKKVEESMTTPDNKPVTVSIGVGSLENEEHKEELVKKADNNLYKAKHLGRNIIFPCL